MAAATMGIAQQAERHVARVKGWLGNAAAISVYSVDGTPKQPRTANLQGQLKIGFLEWNPDYDLIKLTHDPNDDRWVRAKDLDVVFCEKPLRGALSAAGSRGENTALSMGSGAGC